MHAALVAIADDPHRQQHELRALDRDLAGERLEPGPVTGQHLALEPARLERAQRSLGVGVDLLARARRQLGVEAGDHARIERDGASEIEARQPRDFARRQAVARALEVIDPLAYRSA